MTEKQFRDDRQERSKQDEKQSEQLKESFGGEQAALIAAMLEAAGSFECSQLDGDQLFSAASTAGNQSLLAALESSQTEDGHQAVSEILRGADLPHFEEDAPLNEMAATAFEAVDVPQFYFSGGQAAQFSDVQQMALDIAGV